MEGELALIKKWNIIYPVYINSKKTIAEGRRISASKACENPTCMEISDCCSHLKIPHAVEVISRFLYFVLFLRFTMHPNLQVGLLQVRLLEVPATWYLNKMCMGTCT
jgi:SRP19 protein